MARLPGKLPGLYMIQTDDRGERRFFHWRDSAAARSLMDLPQTPEILNSLAGYDVIYLSAITLSLYGGEGRARLFAALKGAREAGARFAFDTNFRARGWPDLDVARAVFQEAFAIADIVLASTEDLLAALSGRKQRSIAGADPWGRGGVEAFGTGEHRAPGRRSLIRSRPKPLQAPVVDTTAAGDSFAAAYVAARLVGADPIEAARAGHRLAGVVVCHPGAIIPRAEMPPGLIPNHVNSRKASP